MRRYRRHRRSYGGKKPAYTWQNGYHYVENLSTPAAGSTKGVLGITTPGVGPSTGVRAFDAPHVLERMRGHAVHVGGGANNDEFAVYIAALRIPSEFVQLMSEQTDQADLIDITDNLEGDDYLYYGAHFCGAAVSENVDKIDNKAKRRFDVGDSLGWLYKIVNPQQSATTLNLGINVRLLWKLG